MTALQVTWTVDEVAEHLGISVDEARMFANSRYMESVQDRIIERAWEQFETAYEMARQDGSEAIMAQDRGF